MAEGMNITTDFRERRGRGPTVEAKIHIHYNEEVVKQVLEKHVGRVGKIMPV